MCQIVLQRLLGYATPRYLHVPVVTNAQGEKLSKQTHAAPVDVANAGAELAAALEFLGQPTPSSRIPEEILLEAVQGIVARGRISFPGGGKGI